MYPNMGNSSFYHKREIIENYSSTTSQLYIYLLISIGK